VIYNLRGFEEVLEGEEEVVSSLFEGTAVVSFGGSAAAAIFFGTSVVFFGRSAAVFFGRSAVLFRRLAAVAFFSRRTLLLFFEET